MVEAMLDFVQGETERIDSRFLEPACGSGNFRVEILRSRLDTVELKYGKSDFEKWHYGLLAVMCIFMASSCCRTTSPTSARTRYRMLSPSWNRILKAFFQFFEPPGRSGYAFFSAFMHGINGLHRIMV